MSKKEQTPFVVDFKSNNHQSNYGAAEQTSNMPSTSTSSTNKKLTNKNIQAIESVAGSGGSVFRTPSSRIYCLHGQEQIEVRDHCHRTRSEGVDVKARKKLIIASVLCLVFMICEIVGGVLSNSLAIATDAAHLLTDFASFMISLFAIWLAGRPSTQRMSFGWYRAEVIGAMASVMMIWVITAILVWLAVQRVIYMDFELNAEIMLITSGLAILVNLIMGCQLQHGHSHGGSAAPADTIACDHIETISSKPTEKPSDISLHLETPKTSRMPSVIQPLKQMDAINMLDEGSSDANPTEVELQTATLQTFSYQKTTSVDDLRTEISAVMSDKGSGHQHAHGGAKKEAVNMNVRAAYIHVIGDMVQSVGVFIAALVIYFRPDWQIVDPICTFVFSIIVLFTTFAIMKDALLVLMEGTPNYMHYNEVLNVFQNIEGVERVHNLRIWALSINKIALSVHLAIEPNANPKKILQDATTAVHRRYNFFETTIQIEEYTPQMDDCHQCTVPEV